MKEKFIIHLGNLEILAIIVRNGLFSGSWKRMRQEMMNNGLFLPGINVNTLGRLQKYEQQYKINMNHIIYLKIHNKFPKNRKKISIKKDFNIQQICYFMCRGLFSYPCLASGNRTSQHQSKKINDRTYLARPIYSNPLGDFIFEGVSRMKPVQPKNQDPSTPNHDQLIEQLNKIRECNTCEEQNSCVDHKFVEDATATVIREYHLEKSFVGKLLARSLCWMSAEESRLMRIIDKEGILTEPTALFPPPELEEMNEDIFSNSESDGYFSENSEPTNLPIEPNPLLDVVHDLRESIRDTIRLLNQMNYPETKS